VKTELVRRTGADGAATRANLREPVAFDVHGVMAGDTLSHVDVYFVERLGSVVYYNGATNTATQIGTIPVAASVTHPNAQSDNGLMGIALDPDFSTNRWVYLWYIPPRVGQQNYRGRLSRFTETSEIVMESERILIDETLSKTHQWHSGGPMQFDAHGDLWVTVGNNSTDHQSGSPFSHFSRTDSTTSDEWGASNTASLRGGIFRIRPDDSAPKGYTIPAGNFGEYWGDYFQSQGNLALAAEYRDTSKVRPELYVKGERSNHSIAVHPTKRWAAWGTVNYQSNRDELNLVSHPAFMGYPYFHGAPNTPTWRTAGQMQVLGYEVDPLAPLNTSPLNSGVEQLPPVQFPALAFTNNSGPVRNVAIGGPIYVYDRNLISQTKFPPHLHNHWLAFGERDNQAHFHLIDSSTVEIDTSIRVDAGAGRLFSNVGSLRHPLQGKYGPEGALYIMFYGGGHYAATPNNNPGIIRIDYVGDCQLEPLSIADRRSENLRVAVQMRGGSIVVREAGQHVFSIHDATGRMLYRKNGVSGAEYSVANLRNTLRLGQGVYSVRVRTDRGDYVRNLPVF
jgi:cytochrome c